MKQLALFLCLQVAFLFLTSCDRELKEHPLPPALKEEIERKIQDSQTGKQVSGVVTLKKDLAITIPKEASLFIFARPEGVTQGPPLAVKKYSLVTFPFEYTVGQSDTMMEGQVFDGALEITARLDMDANRVSSPGDLEGRQTVQAGDKDVAVELDVVAEK